MPTTDYKEKLKTIRSKMEELAIDAYVIPSADPHLSEYLPDHYKCIEFVSGFTGSAGTLVITQKSAGLWTDSRYFLQATEQLRNSGYQLVKLQIPHTPEYIDWLPHNMKVACDFKLLSVSLSQLFKEKGFSLRDADLLSPLWINRPPLSSNKAYLLKEKYSGKSINIKLQELRTCLAQENANSHLISSLDDIAWLFNLRGSDIKCNPVVLAFALISPTQTYLFINPDKLNESEQQILHTSGVRILDYTQVAEKIAEIEENTSILLDAKRTSTWLDRIVPAGVRKIYGTNPSTALKSIKNEVEIENIHKAMIKDGVALTRFIKWTKENVWKFPISELDAAAHLQNLRAKQEDFMGISFESIAGYKDHAALPHYTPTRTSNKRLYPKGFFLIDSGGQYLEGTTDVTRTIALGKLSKEEKTDYTLVLKAMIEGSSARYPKGTCGYQLDGIIRQPLWEHGFNYGHGTGHGVGYFLNVHEGPQSISPGNVNVDLKPGMVTSIEPGIYKPGKHGVRIENLVLTVPDVTTEFAEFYTSETLTLTLIDTEAIVTDLLEQRHIDWLNNYHKMVFNKLSPSLSAEEIYWLKEKTKEI